MGVSKQESVSLKLSFITALVAIGFLAFLLRVRVTDEFKDSGHDAENYPARPVPRGLITRKKLAFLGIAAFVLELGCVLGASLLHADASRAGAYSLVVGYSILTAFEFGVPKWLNRHFNVYFISHQAIFIFFGIWGLSLLGSSMSKPSIAGIGAFVLVMASVEVIRKFEIRTNAAGVEVNDTYLAVWGRTGSIAVLATLTVVNGILLWIWSSNLWFVLAGATTAVVLSLLRRSNRAVQATIVLSFLIHGLAVWLS